MDPGGLLTPGHGRPKLHSTFPSGYVGAPAGDPATSARGPYQAGLSGARELCRACGSDSGRDRGKRAGMEAICDARNQGLVRQRLVLAEKIRALHRTERQQRDSCRSKSNYIAGLFYLSNADTELIMAARATCQAANPPTVIELRRMVQLASIPDLQRHIHFWTNSEQAKARHARGLLREWLLHGWVGTENRVCGRAPSSAEVYTRRCQLVRDSRLHEYVPNEVHSSPQRWVRRFQRRWSMHRRSIEAKAVGSRSEVSGQVRPIPADHI